MALLLPLSACDDSGGFHANDRSGAPRGAFSSGAGSQSGNGAPERGELERLRLDNRSQRPAPPPVPIGGAPASPTGASTNAGEREIDALTGRPTTP